MQVTPTELATDFLDNVKSGRTKAFVLIELDKEALSDFRCEDSQSVVYVKSYHGVYSYESTELMSLLVHKEQDEAVLQKARIQGRIEEDENE